MSEHKTTKHASNDPDSNKCRIDLDLNKFLDKFKHKMLRSLTLKTTRHRQNNDTTKSAHKTPRPPSTKDLKEENYDPSKTHQQKALILAKKE